MQKRRPVDGSGAVLLAGDEQARSTKSDPAPQPATVHQLRARRLVSVHRVRPAIALALAALAFGGGRADG